MCRRGRSWRNGLAFKADAEAQKQAGNMVLYWFELCIALLEDSNLAVCLVFREKISATYLVVHLDPIINSLQFSWLLIY